MKIEAMRSILPILIGILLLLFRKPLARKIIDGQNGLFRLGFAEKEVRASELVLSILGSICFFVALVIILRNM